MRRLTVGLTSLSLGALGMLGATAPAQAAAWYDTWTTATTSPTTAVTEIAYGHGVLVGVGGASSAQDPLWRSTDDGVTWTQVTNPGVTAGIGAKPLRDIAYGNGVFMAVGDNKVVFTSTDDGVTWTDRTSLVPTYTNAQRLQDVTYGAQGFVVGSVHTSGLDDGELLLSADGSSWAQVDNGNEILALAYGNGTYVAFTKDNTTTKVQTSSNGQTWVIAPNPVMSIVAGDLTFAQNSFIGVGQDGTDGYVVTSTNGTSWTSSTVAGKRLYLISGGSNGAVAMDYGNSYPSLTTDAGATWSTGPTAAMGSSVGFGNARAFSVNNGFAKKINYVDVPYPGPLSFAGAAFGTVTAGQTGSATVTVTNSGGLSATPSGITAAGTGVSVTGGSCAVGTAIASAATCTVTLSWAPTATGELSGATLTIAYPGGSSASSSTALTGTASASGSKVQVPLKKLTLPKKLLAGKSTTVTKSAVAMNSGQTAKFSVKCKKGKIKSKKLCKLKTAKSGKVTLKVRKHKVRVTLTASAPATAEYAAYSVTKKYKVK